MPTIAQVRGVSVAIFYADTAPPHIHAFRATSEAVIEIETSRCEGTLSDIDAVRVIRWMSAYERELMELWWRARAGEPLRPIVQRESS